MKRAWLALACVALLAGCSDPLGDPIPAAHPEDPTPRRGGTMHFASFGDIRSLDPAASSDALASEAMELIFAGLVDVDAEGKVVPSLATGWDLSPDGRAYTFHLRPGVLFHDGTALTAADVVRSVERALAPSTPNPFASFFENLEGFADYTEKKAPHLAGVTAEGDHAVVFRLKERDSTFLPLLALHTLRPVCKSGGDRYVDNWTPCGAGPFRLLPGGWDRGRSLTLTRNTDYFDPALPYLDEVVFLYGMNVATQRFKLEDGELEVTRDLNQSDALRFMSDPRWKPYGEFEPEHSIFGENMNVEMPPFDNVEVRRAVAAAIDRNQYHLLRANAVGASGHAIPRGVPGYNPNVRGQEYDYVAALEHMKKAGYAYDPTTDQGGYPTHIEYIAYRQGLSEYTAPLVKQQLAKIGIRIDIKIVSFAAYLSLTHRRRTSALSPQGWSQDYPDALDFYESLFSSKSINEEDSNNSSFYANPTFDGVIEKAHRELDPVKRQALYDDAEATLRDDAPWAFTSTYRWYVVRQPYARDVKTHPSWMYDITHAWIDRGARAVALRSGAWGSSALASVLGVGSFDRRTAFDHQVRR